MSITARVDRLRYGANPYDQPPFYARYLDPANPRDRQIQQLIDVLQANPRNAAAHNELGALLVAKGFPHDAEREYLRAVASDPNLHSAWYNLGLIRKSKGETAGAVQALRRTLDLKPGHASAHFQLGLIHEERGQNERAVEHYAKAFRIDHSLLDVRQNPQLVDTKLVDRALLKLYPDEHARLAVRYQPTPADYLQPESIPEPDRAPSEQPSATEIVTPSQPVTEPSQQPPPPQSPPPPPPQ